MLVTRIVSAAILLVGLILGLGVFSNPLLTLCIVMVFIGAAGMEFFALRWRSHELPSSVVAQVPEFKSSHMIVGMMYALSVWVEYAALNSFLLARTALAAIFAWVSLCVLIISITIYTKDVNLRILVHRFCDAMAGFVYLVFPGIMLFRLAEYSAPHVPKLAALVFVLSVIFIGDTGAYFVGKNFGKHKLIEMVSPKKTKEGAIGGLICSALIAVVIALLYKFPFHWSLALFAGVVLGIAGQIGDLIESAIKRAAGVKDSSYLIPGHGGVLDRIDSILLSVPFGYLFFVLVA